MIQPEMHLHCVPTSPVMSKHCFILLLLHLAVTQLQQCFYTAVSSALLTSSKSQLKKNTHTKKKPTRWLTLDHEEHSHCGKEIIPTTWTTLRPEQLWALLIQHNSNAFKVFCLFFFFYHVWSQIFWHNHIFYHTSACRSRAQAREKELGQEK